MGKTLIGQIGIVAILTILAKVAAFGKDVLLSFVFGAGNSTDAYFIANAIPGLVFAGFFATIGLVFLPIYTRSLHNKSSSPQTIINNAIVIYAAIALGLSAFSMVFADTLVNLSAPGASSQVKSLAVTLTRILAIGFVFSGWVGLQNAIQQSNKSFIWPMTVPLINNVLVIFGLLLSMVYGGIILVAVVAVVGWVVQAPLHGYLARAYYRINLGTPLSPRFVRELLIVSVPVFFSVFLDQINIIIDLVLSSGFEGGAISHLSYAARLSLFFSGLFSLIVSYFIFPHLSSSLASKNNRETRKVLSYGIAIVVLLTTPLAILSVMLNIDIVSIIFQRGAFSPADATATAEVLKFYAIGMLFIAIREVFNRLFYSDQRTIAPLVIGAISAIINVLASLYLMQFMGVAGIAAGTSIGAASYVLMQLVYILIWDRSLIPPRMLLIFAVAGVSGAAMIVTIQMAGNIFANLSTVPQFAAISMVAAIAYSLIALPGTYAMYKIQTQKLSQEQ